MGERSYLSIGQVLDLLKDEFPDLTISKIRFLESQGLLDPERTPSGYRKFYEGDIERLRFILREQQEHYLPLKVIKGRLGGEDDAAEVVVGAAPSVVAGPPVGVAPPPADVPALAGSVPRSEIISATARHPASGPVGGEAPDQPPRLELVDAGDDNEPMSVTLEELAAASGLQTSAISELERYGLLTGHRIAGTTYYDADCVEIASLAAGFRGFGVEARHLRMYRTAVEREAGFFEQVVTPMLKQRNPQARRQAVETLLELSRLGQAMRAAVLRQALRDYTG